MTRRMMLGVKAALRDPDRADLDAAAAFARRRTEQASPEALEEILSA